MEYEAEADGPAADAFIEGKSRRSDLLGNGEGSWGLGAARSLTGNRDADRVLKVVLLRVEQLHPTHRQDLADGVRSLPLQYAFLVGQTGLDSVDVHLALEWLHDRNYLRVDFGYPKHDGRPGGYGVNVWPMVRLEPAA